MLKDLDNIDFRFFVVDKRTWIEMLYSMEDIISNTKQLPEDPPDTDTKATILHHCQEMLGNVLYAIAKDPYKAPCVGAGSDLFDLFKNNLEQDELNLKVERSDEAAWTWAGDYPCCWGTISKDAWVQILGTLKDLVDTPAIELTKKVKNIDYVIRLYELMCDVDISKDSDIIVFQGLYEDDDMYDY